MDLFPDWSEIELKVKILMVGLHVLATLLMCALIVVVGRNWSSRRRVWTLVPLSGAFGLGLFISMFLFDWAEILPPYHKAWVTTQQPPAGDALKAAPEE